MNPCFTFHCSFIKRAAAFLIAVIILPHVALAHEHDRSFVIKEINAVSKTGKFNESLRPFTVIKKQTDPEIESALKSYIQIDFSADFRKILEERPEYLKIKIPVNENNSEIDLLLTKTDISKNGFTLITEDGKTHPEFNNSVVHYRGMINGDDHSLVSLSFSNEETMGLISDANGNLVLGKTTSGKYIIYNDSDLNAVNPFECSTETSLPAGHIPDKYPDNTVQTVNCVNWYWEIDNDVFNGKGSLANTNSYIQGIFNQVSTLYANDGMSITLQTVFVWTTTDPYTGPSTSNYLTQFGNYRTSFAGDLANLIGYQGGGGVAYVDGFCNSQARYRMGYCGISSTYNTVPTYSWTVEVVAHEEGHLFGSRHTHDCVWNGNNTAIDGCGNASGYASGSCPAGPIPTKGTIMSYCHLSPNPGINLALGFGPQPTTLMVNNVNTSNCLSACGPGCTTAPPQPGTISGNTAVCQGATVTYSVTAVSGATSYSWALPNGWSGSSATNSITLTAGSTAGSISVTAINACGNSNARSLNVTVNPVPGSPGAITKTGGSKAVCPGETRTFKTTGVNNVSYNWTVPAGAIITSGQGSKTIIVQFNSNFSGGNISVAATNSCGNSPQMHFQMLRNNPATPSAITGPNTGLCAQQLVNYSVKQVAGMSYNWTVPSGAIIVNGQGTNAVQVSFPSTSISGNISVNAVNACGAGPARSKMLKSITSIPGTISGNTSVCPNTSGNTYSIAAVPGALTYSWKAPWGSVISDGIITSTTNSLTTASTTVTVNFANINSSSNINVKANNACGSSHASKILLTGNGCRTGAGLTSNGVNLNIYPNPATDLITVSFESSAHSIIDLQIMDLTGKVILKSRPEVNAGFNHLELGIDKLNQGMYLLNIITPDGSFTEKIEVL